MLSGHYIQKGLLFAKPPQATKEDGNGFMEALLGRLKNSLSKVLVHFYPLAGRLKTIKGENPHSILVYVDCNDSPGAKFIYATLDMTLSDIISQTYVPPVVQSFFDHHKAVNHDGHSMSLLSVQVTELVDGVFIGCSMNHCLAHELKERIFHFSAESIVKLKAKANAECNVVNQISSLQSLAALVWRCITRARNIPSDQLTSCKLFANDRSRLDPPVSDNYFGNMLHKLTAFTTAGELLEHDLGWAASKVHKAVANFNNKKVHEWLDEWLRSPYVYPIGRFFDPNCVMMGSSPKFNKYASEFGMGKAVALCSGYASKFDGKVCSYPGREGGGSIDLEICLLPDRMCAFESDKEFIEATM
ncbi:BAHD acyltransferase DCR [Morus notabilis]|uniref:BAHD acyltransferase DCR n=1 Tax=Morus notabilis TaxID=981085 RepID=W9SME2_9ROSA|nr:BAHD acyltransferase DCR [Morus notabilis]